jgi:transcriptional regulator with XRE-family HTH domain
MCPFGETVLAWRLARGMTQAELARAARVPRPNLSAIERGDREVTLCTLRALALALGVKPGVLVDGIGPEAPGKAMSRAGLERVAAAAEASTTPSTAGATLGNARESRLARRLAKATAGGRTGRLGARAADRAYFLLKTAATPAVLGSLFDRMADRRRRP